MPFNSWQSHLRSINESDAANRNFGAFVDAFRDTKLSNDMINAITEDPNGIILVVENQKVKFMHSCKKIGGTRTKPTVTVACLTGQGATALPIVIDPNKAIKSKEVTIPAIKNIWKCKTMAELSNLEGGTPLYSTRTMRMQMRENKKTILEGEIDKDQSNGIDREAESQTNTEGASSKSATKTIYINPVFIPIPFLAITALENISHNPLELILAVKTVTKDFIQGSKGANPPAEDPTKGAKFFTLWLYAAHMKLINKTKFSIEPDNKEVKKHAEICHRDCILPPLEHNAPPLLGITENESMILQLIQSTNRGNKIHEETMKI
jgi:hypothetical protein